MRVFNWGPRVYRIGDASDELFAASEKNDFAFGNGGADTISGLAGDDFLQGGLGDDELRGGAGADSLGGGGGSDTLFYEAAVNSGGDVYDGGAGVDGLTFEFTAQEYADPALRAELDAFAAFLAENGGAQSDLLLNLDEGASDLEEGVEIDAGGFYFETLDLFVQRVEAVRVLVDGAPVGPNSGGGRIDLQDDAFEIDEDALNGALQGDVADNDSLNGQSLTLVAPTAQGSLTFSDDGSFTFDPAGAFEDLAVGETRDVTFTYAIAGAGPGAEATATITVFGANDAPSNLFDFFDDVSEDFIDPATGLRQVTFDGLANGFDVDGDALTISNVVIDGFDGRPLDVAFDPGGAITLGLAAFDDLAAGEVAVLQVTFDIADGNGGTAVSSSTISILGVNDAPEVTGLTAATDEDTPDFTLDLLAGQTDPDLSDVLTASNLAQTGGATSGATLANGALSLDATVFNGLAEGESEILSFTYDISDGIETVRNTVEITVAGLNDAPEVTGLTAATDEDTPDFTLDLLAGQTDPDLSDVLTASNLAQTGGATSGATLANGALSLDATVFNALAEGESEILSFTYDISDGIETVRNSVEITVAGVNDAPEVTGLTAATDEDTPDFTLDLLAGQTDPDLSDVLTASNLAQTGGATSGATLANGALSLDATVFNALAEGESEILSFTYDISDGIETVRNTVEITVAGLNDAPEVTGLTAATDEDTPDFTLDLLAGQTDPDLSDVLTASNLAQTGGATSGATLANGALSLDATVFNGLAEGESEILSFTYDISDGIETVRNTVEITVAGLNDAPEVTGLTATTDEDTPDFTLDLLAGQTDPDLSDVLTAANLVQTGGATSGATLANGALSLDATVFNTLAEGESEILSFTYDISDGIETVRNTVEITVAGLNDAPEVTELSATTNEDVADFTFDLFTGASDPDATDVLSIANLRQISGPGAAQPGLSGGLFQFDATAFDGLAAGESAVLVFAFDVTDGAAATPNSFTLTIEGRDEAQIAFDDAFAILENEVLADDVSANDAVPPGATASYALISRLQSGALDFSDDGSFTFDPLGDFDGLAAGESAELRFTYEVAGVTAGGADFAEQAEVVISIAGENDAPEEDTLSFSVGEDDALSGTLQLVSDRNANGAGDIFDADRGDVLRVLSVDGLVIADGGAESVSTGAGAALTVASDGTFSFDASGFYDFLPVGDAQFESFELLISDAAGALASVTLDIEVAGANDAPSNLFDFFDDVSEDFIDPATGLRQVTFDGLANGFDVDGDALTISNVVIDGFDGRPLDVAFDPGGAITLGLAAFDDLAAGEVAVLQVTFDIADGNGGTAVSSSTISILGVNDAPEVTGLTAATDEDTPDFTLDLLAGQTDPDLSDVLTASNLAQTGGATSGATLANGALSLDATVFNGLAEGESEILSFTYDISDGIETVRNTVEITVAGLNDAPEVTGLTAATDEDTPDFTLDLLAGQTDPDATDVLTVANLVQTGGATSGATLANGALSLDATVFNALAEGESEILSFTYDISDGIETVRNSVEITVAGVNDAPEVTGLTAATDEDTPDFTLDLLAGQTDPDLSDVLTASNLAQTGGATSGATLANGALSLDATVFNGLAEGESEILSFTYDISDGIETVRNTVEITVAGLNDAPEVTGLTAATDEDTPDFTLDLLAGQTDPDATDVLTVANLVQTGGATSGAVLANGALSLDATVFNALAEGESEILSFTYDISDGIETVRNTVEITVAGLNDAPEVTELSATTNEDVADFTFDLFTGASDPDATDVLSIANLRQISGPGAAQPGLSGGLFQFDATAFDGLAAGESAVLVFAFDVTDGAAATPNSFTLTIEGRDEAQIAFDDAFAILENEVLADDVSANDAVPPGATASYALISRLQSGALDFSDDGSFTFDPLGDFDGLAAGESAELRFTYEVAGVTAGGADFAEQAEVVISIAGENDAPEEDTLSFSVGEDDALSGTLQLVSDRNANGAGDIFDADRGDVLRVLSVDGLVIADGGAESVSTGAGAALTVASDGTFSFDASGFYDFLPVGDAQFESFELLISDAAGALASVTLDIEVAGANDAPSNLFDFFDDVSEDFIDPATGLRQVTFDGLANGFDVDGDALTISNVVIDGFDGRPLDVAFDPGGAITLGLAAFDDLAAGEVAVLQVTFDIADGNGGTAVSSSTISILGVNDAPEVTGLTAATDEDTPDFTLDLLAGQTDPDLSDVLTASNLAQTGGATSGATLANGALSLDATVFNGLAEGESEILSFTYDISDGIETVRNTVEITVAGLNDAPEVTGLTAATDEDTPDFTLDLLAGQTDPDATDVLTVANLVQTGGATSGATLANGALSLDATVFNALAEGESEILSFTYDISDGIETVRNTVEITVAGLNDAPEIDEGNSTLFANLSEGDAPTTAEGAVLFFDADVNDAHRVAATVAAVDDVVGITDGFDLDAAFSLTLDQAGRSIGYAFAAPADAFTGLGAGERAEITYAVTVTDAAGAADAVDVVIEIAGANDAPEVGGPFDAATRTSDAFITIDLLDGATDADFNDVLTVENIAIQGDVFDFTLTDDRFLNVDLTQFAGAPAGDTLTFFVDFDVTDGIDAVGDTLSLDVLVDRNEPPEATNALLAFTEDAGVVVINLATDGGFDPDDQPFALSLASVTDLGTGISFEVDGDAIIIDASQFDDFSEGEVESFDLLEYTLTDGADTSGVGALTITVTGVNDAPQTDDLLFEITQDDGFQSIDLLETAFDVDRLDTLFAGDLQQIGGRDVFGVFLDTGFLFTGGDAFGAAGSEVALVEDVNRDGIGDILITADGLDEAYLVFGGDQNLIFLDGSDGAFDNRIDLSALDSRFGYTLVDTSQAVSFADAIASIGDLNGDGAAELGFAGRGADAAYILFGGAGLDALAAGGSRIDLADAVGDASLGLRLEGLTGSATGFAISSAGDVTGDMTDDFILGDPGDTGDLGAAYLIFGERIAAADRADGVADGVIDVRLLDDAAGANGLEFVAPAGAIGDADRLGFSVDGGENVVGTPEDDLLILSLDYSGDSRLLREGAVSIVAGGAAALSELDAGADGEGLPGLPDGRVALPEENSSFTIVGDPGDNESVTVSIIEAGFLGGDVNGDGVGDIFVSHNDRNFGIGEFNNSVSIFFGGNALFEADLADGAGAGADGFIALSAASGATGYTFTGLRTDGTQRAASLGDIDGGGAQDLIITDHIATDDPSVPGRAYILYGETLAIMDGADGARDGFIDINNTLFGPPFGAVIEGIDINFAASLSAGRDVGGDGADDYILGATRLSANIGGAAERVGGAFLGFGGANFDAFRDNSDFTPDLRAPFDAFSIPNFVTAEEPLVEFFGDFIEFDAQDFAYLGEGEVEFLDFVYDVSDGIENTTTTLIIEITGFNDPLETFGNFASAFEDDGEISFDLLANAFDADESDVLSVGAFTQTGGPDIAFDPFTGATFTFDITENLNFLSQGASVTLSFVYEVTSTSPGGAEETQIETLDIEVTGANDAPIAMDDAFGGTAPDLVIFTSNEGAIFLDDGDGGFLRQRDTLPGGAIGDTAVGDFNGDGFLDIAAPRAGGGNNVVYFNDGTGRFDEFTTVSGPDQAARVAAADFDLDGDLDLVFTGDFSSGEQELLFLNDGAGAFTEFTNARRGGPIGTTGAGDVAAGDLDGDGDADIVLVNRDGLVIERNDRGSFTQSFVDLGLGVSASLSRAELGDFNGDGSLDVFAIAAFGRDYRVFLNDGSGGFSAAFNGDVGSSNDVALGDVDGDGRLDAVIATLDGENIILLGNRDGSFSELSERISLGSVASSVALADLDGDGDLDVIFTASEGGVDSVSRYFLNEGLRGFSEIGEALLTARAFTAAVGNFDAITPNSVVLLDPLANDLDLDEFDALSLDSVSASAIGATISISGSEIAYDATTSAAAQALLKGETLIDTFTYTITDDFGERATATATVEIAGVRTPLIESAFSLEAGEDDGPFSVDLSAGATPGTSGRGSVTAFTEDAGVPTAGYAFRSDAAGLAFDVAGVGDQNGDGIEDFVLTTGARSGEAAGLDFGDLAWLVFGGEANLAALDLEDGRRDAVISVEAISSGEGYVFLAPETGGATALGVTGAGDVTGIGGFEDILFGRAFRNGGEDAGGYLIEGGRASLATLDGADGAVDGVIRLDGAAATGRGYEIRERGADGLGEYIANIGDLDGDGRADFALAREEAPGGFTGSSFTVFLGGDSSLSALDETDGVVDNLIGPDGAGDGAAFTFVTDGVAGVRGISAAGDVDGDGIDDLLIAFAADSATGAGAVSVIFGGALADLDAADGVVDGAIQLGAAPLDAGEARLTAAAGVTAVAGIGDINNDGFADFAYGLADAGAGGEAVVIFGSAENGPGARLDPNALQDNGAALRLLGANGAEAGSRIEGLGDVNGDGADDFVVVAAGTDRHTIVFGGADLVARAAASGGAFDLDDLPGLGLGFAIIGDGSGFAPAISGIGDQNGDGFADILIATPDNGSGDGGQLLINGGPVGLAVLDGLDGAEDGAVDFAALDVNALAAIRIEGDALLIDPRLFNGLGDTEAETFSYAYTLSDGFSSVDTSVTVTINGANDAPVVTDLIAPVTALYDRAFSFTVPDGVFTDPEGDALTLSADLGGAALPDWLSFDAATGVFTGTPGVTDIADSYEVTLTAADPSGAATSLIFSLEVGANFLDGTSGRDLLNGSTAQDVARGFEENDSIFLSLGSDVALIAPGDGFDIVTPSLGDDILFFDGFAPEDLDGVTRFGSVGDAALLRFPDGEGALAIDAFAGFASVVVGETVIDPAALSALLIEGLASDRTRAADGDFGDIIRGTSIADRIDGGLGDDFLAGGRGSDIYSVAAGSGVKIVSDAGGSVGDDDLLEITGAGSGGAVLRTADGLYRLHSNSARDETLIFDFERGGRLEVQGVLDGSNFTSIDTYSFTDSGESFTTADFRARLLESAATGGDDAIYGYGFDETLAGGRGDDLLVGARGADSYLYAAGDGRDAILDQGAPSTGSDEVLITGYSFADASIQRIGASSSIILDFGGGDALHLIDAFNGGFSNGIERFAFDADGDGAFEEDFSIEGFRQALIETAQTSGDDRLIGFIGDDVIDGGPGDDFASGGLGADIYRFEARDGLLVIKDNGFTTAASADVIEISGLSLADARFERDEFSPTDLIIRFDATGDEIRAIGGLGDRGDGIELVRFNDDGVALDKEDLRQAALDGQFDAGADVVTGFDSDDALEGGAGRDTLSGGAGSDIYVVRPGDGETVIIEPERDQDRDIVQIAEVNGADFDATGSGVSAVIIVNPARPNDLAIRFGSGESLTLAGAFANDGLEPSGAVEAIVFDDGVGWSMSDLREWIGDASLAPINVTITVSDVTTGDSDANTLTASSGSISSVLIGSNGDDTYVVERGAGDVEVSDNAFGADTLDLRAFSLSDATFGRDIDANDLRIDFASGDSVVVPRGLGRAGSVSVIETFLFTNSETGAVETLTLDQVRQRVVDDETTDGDDLVQGMVGEQTITSSAGTDYVSGGGGDDTYVYQLQAGAPGDLVISDLNFGADLLRITGDDALSFGLALGDPDDLVFEFANGGSVRIVDGVANTFNGENTIERFEITSNTLNGSFTVEEIVDDLILQILDDRDGENDRIDGFSGAETYTGGAGSDTISGGAGDDTYVYNFGDGDDFITEGGAGNDTLEINLGFDTAVLSIDAGSIDDLRIQFGADGGGGSILVEGGLSSTFNRMIETYEFADRTLDISEIRQIVVDTQIDGASPTIIGTVQADIIRASGEGVTHAIGRTGDDRFLFGAGDGFFEIALGGSGGDARIEISDFEAEDVFVSRMPGASDDLRITFAGAPEDEIVVRGGLSTSVGQAIAELEIASPSGRDAVLLTREELRQLAVDADATDFDDLVQGTGGNDSIAGGLGDDTLIGGSGSDTFFFTRGDGRDQIEEGGSGEFDQLVIFNDGLIIDSANGVVDGIFFEPLAADSDALRITFANEPGDEIFILDTLDDSRANEIEALRVTNGVDALDFTIVGGEVVRDFGL